MEQSGMTSGSCALWIDSVDVVAVRGGNHTVSSLSLRPAPDTSDLSTPNEAGSITDVVELNLWYRNHAE